MWGKIFLTHNDQSISYGLFLKKVNLIKSYFTKQKINEGENIYLNYSISSRKPNPSELFSEGLHHSSARIEMGDLSFQSEVGNNISLTYNVSNEKSALTFNSFVNYVNDFIYIIPRK